MIVHFPLEFEHWQIFETRKPLKSRMWFSEQTFENGWLIVPDFRPFRGSPAQPKLSRLKRLCRGLPQIRVGFPVQGWETAPQGSSARIRALKKRKQTFAEF
jgi:hypothetical protein